MDYGIKQACTILKSQKKTNFDGQTVKYVEGIDTTDFLKDILSDVQPDLVVLGTNGIQGEQLAAEIALESPYTIAIVK